MENLCSVCLTLDLPYYFDLPKERVLPLQSDLMVSEETEIQFGSLGDILDRSSSCAFCAFLLHNADNQFREFRFRHFKIDWSRRVLIRTKTVGSDTRVSTTSFESAACKLAFEHKWVHALSRLGYERSYVDDLDISFDTPRGFPGCLTKYCSLMVQLPACAPADWGLLSTFGQLCASTIPRAAERFYERRLNVVGPDFDLLRTWLRTCLAHHGHHCENPPKLRNDQPKFLRLIDVQRRCVVMRQTDTRYAALSYVWGGSQLTASEEDLEDLPWYLPERPALSPVVADALEVCRRLDLKYLWVDALCIVQQPYDNADKAVQIQQMDTIYSSAVLTICAVSSRSASQGIPGLRARSVKQEVITCKGRSYAKLRDNHYDIVDKELWNRRAWTYQERILSRRVMFITEQEVFWICQCEAWAEGIVAEPQDTESLGFFQNLPLSSFSVPAWQVGLQRPGAMEVGDPVYGLYQNIVDNYTGRQLGDHRDGLNAIDGVLRRLSRSGFQGHVMGLPVSYFDISLLWRRHTSRSQSVVERLSLPSWSWTAWSHDTGSPVTWDLSDCDHWSKAQIKGAVEWRFVSSDGSSVGVEGLKRGDGKVPGLNSWGPQGGKYKPPPPIVRGLPPAPAGFYMHFRSTMVSLAVGPRLEWKDKNDIHWPVEWESVRQDPYELVDQAGDCVGHIILPANVARDIETVELIFLSYSSKFDVAVRASKRMKACMAGGASGSFQIVNAMAVERSKHSPLFYERISIAKVHLKAWMAAGPDSQWIVLG